jgi:hypothetical protein
MKDPESLVYAWDGSTWREIAWNAFVEWRQEDSSLPGLTGDTRFVVIVLDDDETAINALPHRYTLDQKGRLLKASHDAIEAQRKRYLDLLTKRTLTADERQELDAMPDRDYKFALPPQDQITKLLATLQRPVNPDGGIKWMREGAGMDAFGWKATFRVQ